MKLNITILFLKLGNLIKSSYPDIKVIYTRSSDKYVELSRRAEIANRNRADLFISIHCNGSSSPEAKGTSVHILGQNSNNKKNKTDYFERNMSVAQRENSVIVLEEERFNATIDAGLGILNGLISEAKEKGESVMYDLQGRKIANPQKGIYIKNGKKVIY